MHDMLISAARWSTDWVAIAWSRCCSRPGRSPPSGPGRRPGTPRGRRPWPLGHAGGSTAHPLRRSGHMGRGARTDGLPASPRSSWATAGRLRPVRPDRHDCFDRAHGGSQDIPGTALAEGSLGPGDLPRVLDASIDATRHPGLWRRSHGAVRAYVIGASAAAKNEPATPRRSPAMKAIREGGIEAGASGFSTSRTLAHVAIDGEPVPGTFARQKTSSSRHRPQALGRLGTGIFELAPEGAAGEDVIGRQQGGRLDGRLVRCHRPAGHLRPSPGRRDPGLWSELLELTLIGEAEGAPAVPQVPAGRSACSPGITRPTHSSTPSRVRRTQIEDLSPDELFHELSRPEVREAIVSWCRGSRSRCRHGRRVLEDLPSRFPA